MSVKYLYIILMFLSTTQLHACNSGDESGRRPDSKENTKDSTGMGSMKIKITISGNVFKATLNDSETARDFASLLPMTLILSDYAQTEKVSNLNKQLITTGSASGSDPDVGDITYYAPWGNLAIFYKDFGYAEGLIKLGKIDGDISLFGSKEKLEATFEMVESSKTN